MSRHLEMHMGEEVLEADERTRTDDIFRILAKEVLGLQQLSIFIWAHCFGMEKYDFIRGMPMRAICAI